MLNARECRRQAAVCRAEARVTESIGASTTLTAMARSWAMLPTRWIAYRPSETRDKPVQLHRVGPWGRGSRNERRSSHLR